MTIPIPSRWRQALALGFIALPVGSVTADDPLPVPPPTRAELQAPPQQQRSARDVIIMHGTSKVYPVYTPKPAAVLPAEAKPWPGAPVEVRPPTVQEDTRLPAAPPTEIVVKIEDRPPQPAPQIVLTGYAMPMPSSGPFSGSAPWLVPTPAAAPPAALPMPATVAPVAPIAAAPAAPQQPTVVVIRESGDARPPAPVVEQPRGMVVGVEAMFGLGVGLLGVGFGLAGWLRRSAAASSAASVAAAMKHPVPPSHGHGDGLLLMGKYNAGPRREAVERFDLGPSYQTQKEEKKKSEEASQQAVLEFILSQNVALHADLFGPAEAAMPEAVEQSTDPTTK